MKAPEVKVVSWPDHMRRMRMKWKPGQHISILAPNGEGKTVLLCRGLFDIFARERVTIIDVKGDDKELRIGEACKKFPSSNKRSWRRVMSMQKQAPPDHYRIVLTGPRGQDREVTFEALDKMYKEGNWVILIDETRAVTGTRAPDLNLAPSLDALWLRGRSRKVTLVALTQAPRFVPAAFYEQSKHIYIGRMLDRRARKRLEEIGGDTDAIEQALDRLKRFEFVYIGDAGHTIHIVKYPYGRN